MRTAQFIPVHATAGNAPAVASVLADSGLDQVRYFYGTGAPSSSTLLAGNARYNASTSGFVLSATLVNAGSGYVVGDVLTASGGTGTALQITVDSVNAGAILAWHVSRVGTYSAYPTNPAGVTGGTGSGATFNLNFPAADFYFDVTTATAPVLYVCTTSGSNSGSVWAQVVGSGGNTLAYFKIVSDGGNYLLCYTYNPATGATGSTLTAVAKPYFLRTSNTSQTIRGVTYTYTYTAVTSSGTTIYYTRAVSGSDGSSETDLVIPDYLVGSYILAVQLNTGLTYSGAAVMWADINQEGRAWSQI